MQVDYYRKLVAANILPGFEGTQSFSVKNNSSKTVAYTINLKDVANSFVSNDLQYSIVKDGTKTIKGWTSVPRSSGPISSKIIIGPGETAYFDINYRFVETHQNQDADMGKSFVAGVEITFDENSVLGR